MMNIYFSCSLTGGRSDEAIYAHIVDHLISAGHEVPTAHLARPEVMEAEKVAGASEVYQRDIHWIETADGIIAEVSTPSHGVGYEIAYGLERGKRVLCCYRSGVTVSKMITGNNSPGLTVVAYRDPGELISMVDQFLKELI
jgi:nucleoside 2-deoxyribosyltransferase